MRSARGRTAAAAWGVTLAAVGVGVVTCGRQGDGTHYDFCARGILIPPITADVTLTGQYPGPVLRVHAGEGFTVKVEAGASPVVEPKVTRQHVVCQATRSAPAVHLRVTFAALHPGTTYLLSSTNQGGGSAGVSVGVYSATVIVSPTH